MNTAHTWQRLQFLAASDSDACPFTHGPGTFESRARRASRRPSERCSEIELIGEDEQSIPFEAYSFELPGGTRLEGRLDSAGFARHDNLPNPGVCHVCFPRLDEDAWQPHRTSPARAAPR